MRWRTRSRAARAIRFLETYCVPPKGHGAREPLRLARFQKEWLEASLADDVGAVAMQLPRGNGKSTFLAGVAVWAVFDPDREGGAPQVPVVATTMGQAVRSVYGVCTAMIQAQEDLDERALTFTATNAPRVRVPFTGGELFPISNDTDGLQGLDPSLAVCDELGFMPLESWDSLLLAAGKRPRSLVVGIGTPGIDRDNALWHLRRRVESGRPLRGFRFTEYAATYGCAVDDVAEWKRANPALAAGYMRLDALETALDLSPEAHFRIFRLGQWIDGVDNWLGPDGRAAWDALRDPYVPVSGVPTWVGVDVGIKRDSTAVVAVQRRPDGRWHAWARIWLPTKDEPVDVTDVMHHLRTMARTLRLERIGFDTRYFDVPAKMLDDEGLPMAEIPQSVETMTPAIGSLFEAIRRGNLSHDGEPAFSAQILNGIPRFNDRGFTLAKGKSRGRIDAAVALAIALYLAERQPAPAAAFNIW